jgi:molecular chaperone DnaJ
MRPWEARRSGSSTTSSARRASRRVSIREGETVPGVAVLLAAGREGGPEESFGRHENYEDLFGDLFGFAGGGGDRAFRDGRKSKGRDLEHEMAVDFLAALRGVETELVMEKTTPCPRCQGSGTEPGRNSSLSGLQGLRTDGRRRGAAPFHPGLPAVRRPRPRGNPCGECAAPARSPEGNESGEDPPGCPGRRADPGRGKRGTGKERRQSGGPLFENRVSPTPLLTRKGDDLYLDVPVTVLEALGGGQARIPTVDGEVNVKIPPGARTARS